MDKVLPEETPPLLPCPRKRRHVRFDLDACMIHEIPAYAEIYGLHPREFDFGRWFYMIPVNSCQLRTAQSGSCDGIEDSSDEEEEG